MTKVLFIDDDIQILTVLNEYFSLEEDFEVEIASSADEGFLKAKSFCPDVIFLDIMMPGKTGLELIKEFKMDELTKYVPIVMLTADGTDASRFKAMRSFCEDYMSKPVTFFEIKKTLFKVMEKKRKFENKV